MIAEGEIEVLRRRRDGFATEANLVADEQAFDVSIAVIFENMMPQAAAVFAVDDDAATGAGIAFVGYDQLQRMAKQFDMFVVNRGHRGYVAAEQANRIVTAADAGLEHHEFAIALLEIEAGEREHGFERAELLASPLRNDIDRGSDAFLKLAQGFIVDRRAADIKPLVDAKQMR